MAMPYSVSTSEFGRMSEKQKAEAVSKLVRAAFKSPNGQAKQLDAQIEEFERQYGITSKRLLEELSAGRRKETDKISDWLWLLNLRGRGRLS